MATQKNPPEGYPLMPTGSQGEGVYPQLQSQLSTYPPGPILAQPVPRQNIPNCPPGLEYLSVIDQLLVKQKIELIEVLTDFETKNKYVIANTLGQQIYFAGEESGCCGRNCCGSIRQFDMKILDNFGQQVMRFHRPLACKSCCFPCCLQTMEIMSPPGTPIGVVIQEWSILKPHFIIKNANDEIMLRIKGPFWTCRCYADVKFKVYSVSGTEIGKISKQWSGAAKELLTDADNFNVTFPADLDVKMKACLLGALFLIDMMYFESD